MVAGLPEVSNLQSPMPKSHVSSLEWRGKLKCGDGGGRGKGGTGKCIKWNTRDNFPVEGGRGEMEGTRGNQPFNPNPGGSC